MGLGLSWASGLSWVRLGLVWGRLRSVLEMSWGLGVSGGGLGVSLKRIWSYRGPSWACLEVSWACEGSLGMVLAVASLYGVCFGLSQAVLEATRRFWTTVSRFQAILVITLGARTRFWTTVARFQAILGAVLGHQNKGPPPPKVVFGAPWGRLRGGIPKGYRRNLTA